MARTDVDDRPDTELNPGQHDWDEGTHDFASFTASDPRTRDDYDRAFNDITSDDNMSRGAVRDAEENPTDNFGYREDDGKDARREQDRKEFLSSENQFGYRGGEATNRQNNRRRNMIAGGVAGGVVGIAITLFGSLLPLKIPGIMQMITDEAGQRVEQITVHRAKVILARAIMEKLGVPGGPVITGEGPLSSLIATMKTNGFEQRLAENGIEFVKEGNGVTIKENGKTLKASLKSESAIVEALDGGRVTSEVIRKIVHDDIPFYRFAKRLKYAQWLRLRYAIPRYGILDSKETNPDKRAVELASKEVDTAAARQAKMVDDIMNILRGTDRDGQSGQATRDASGSVLKGSSAEKAAEVKKLLEGLPASEVKAIMKKVTMELSKDIVKKVATKFIPYYGWVMLPATIVVASHWVLVHGTDGSAARAIASVKGGAMAAMYGDFAGLSSQVALDEMPEDYHAYYAERLDGAEESRSYNCIQSDMAASCKNAGEPMKNRIDERNPQWLKDIADWYKNTSGRDLATDAKLSNYIPVVQLAYFLYWFDGWITGVAFDIIAFITQIATGPALAILQSSGILGAAEAKLQELTEAVFPFMLKMAGLDVNLLASGPELFNILYAGGSYSFNQYCELQYKCHEISPQTSFEQRQEYQRDKQQYIASKGWAYALFSPDVTSSLTSQFALSTSTTNGHVGLFDATASLSRIVASTPKTVSSLLSPQTYAAQATPEDITGIIPMGLTKAEQDTTVSYEALDGKECATTPTMAFDPCFMDKEIIGVIICSDLAKIEEVECNPDKNTGGASPATTTASGSCPAGSAVVPEIKQGYDSGGYQPATFCAIDNTTDSSLSGIRDADVFRQYNDVLQTNATGKIVVRDAAAADLVELVKKYGKSFGATFSYRSHNQQCVMYFYTHRLSTLPSACSGLSLSVANEIRSKMSGGYEMPGSFYVSKHESGVAMDVVDLGWVNACASGNYDGDDSRYVSGTCFNYVSAAIKDDAKHVVWKGN